jgi:hypothetical protein
VGVKVVPFGQTNEGSEKKRKLMVIFHNLFAKRKEPKMNHNGIGSGMVAHYRNWCCAIVSRVINIRGFIKCV